MSRALDVDGSFGRFSRRLLLAELPELPADRLDATTAFVCRRARQIPGPLRLGVIGLASGVGLSERTVDPAASTEFLRHTSLPLIGELARMVRSLGFAYIWETWPATLPDGGAPMSEVAT